MAAYHYVIIPSDPSYLPTSEQEKLALDSVRQLIPSATMETWRSDHVQVVGGFRPHQTYHCPQCGKQSNMTRDETFSFGEMLFVESASEIMLHLPCCGADCSLAALRYAPNLGFAQFGIDISALPHPPAARVLEVVAKALGSPILLIRTPIEA